MLGTQVPLNARVLDDSSQHGHEAVARALAGAIRRCRADLGLSQEELAARVGIATRHLQKIEAGEVNVTLRTLAKLATAVGVTASQLLELQERDQGGAE